MPRDASASKSMAKRHAHLKRGVYSEAQAELRLPLPVIQRLMLRGGIPRMSKTAMMSFRKNVLLPMLERTVTVAVAAAESRNAGTLHSSDVKRGLAAQGVNLYVKHLKRQASRKHKASPKGNASSDAEQPKELKKPKASKEPKESKEPKTSSKREREAPKTGPKSAKRERVSEE